MTRPNNRSGARRPIILVHLFACVFGGMEQWALSLMRSIRTVDWRIWIQEGGVEDPRMVRQFEEVCEVFRAHEWEFAKDGVSAFVSPGHLNTGKIEAPTVIVAHGSASYTESLMNRFARYGTKVVAVSQQALNTIPPQRRDEACVLWPVIEESRCKAMRSRAATRRDWGIGARELALGFVGRICADKRPEATARAASAVGATAIFVGEAYEHLAKRSVRKVSRQARFVSPVARIGDALSAFDCLVMCSRFEGFGLALAEAMIAGCPVVTTSVGFVPELESRHGPITVTVRHDAGPNELREAVLTATSQEHRHVVRRAKALSRELFCSASATENWRSTLLEAVDSCAHRA